MISDSVYSKETNTYFPVSEHGGGAAISSFEEEWYSKHLRIMEESSIYSARGDKYQDIYRFTLLPT